MSTSKFRSRGRPVGSGPHGEKTQPVRIPKSLVKTVRAWLAYRQTYAAEYPQPISLAPSTVSLMAFANRELAGLPSSAQLYLDDTIDLNAGLIIPGHEASTFVLWVRDRSMIQAGIFDGDWIVVDRELVAKDDDVVVAVFNNAFTIKRLGKIAGKVALLPENPHFKPIVKEANDTLEIWGVVTNCLRRLQRHVAALRASTDCEH